VVTKKVTVFWDVTLGQVDVYQIHWCHIPEESNFHLIGSEFFVVCLAFWHMQFLIICIIHGYKRRYYLLMGKIVSPAVM
jgi:hypothetical protein